MSKVGKLTGNSQKNISEEEGNILSFFQLN